MEIGVQIPDFTFPSGPDRLGADLAAIARARDPVAALRVL
jgi:hypothetical protein